MANVDAYFQGGLQTIQRHSPSDNNLNVDECLSKCIIKKHSIEEIDEYQIYAYCRGSKLFKGIPPYMVSSHAIDEILPLLSNPTTDFLNGFYDKHFKPDPSLMEPDPSPKLVFI